ncbi:MAG: ABC transporter permease [Deltaproteobacteria bacterium]|nr:MAG: ABC transporter permease [Deltaproteobacteria bacterium]
MINLSWYSFIWIYLLLFIPLTIFYIFKITLVRESIEAVLRMTVQLLLVGLYLKFIFKLNNIWLTLLWIVIMLFVANFSVLGKTELRRSLFFWRTLWGLSVSTLLVTCWFIGVVIGPEPLYDARYAIPVMGIVLGNCMRGNVLSLERFYSELRSKEEEYMTQVYLGASLREAVVPFLRNAVRAAANPSLVSIATTGIVSLPGMMTGQILGGSPPMQAILYQIAIMICIYAAIVLSTICNILLSLHIAFDDHLRLRADIFREMAKSLT